MLEYRLYILSENNRVERAIELVCEDDAAAISAAESHQQHSPLELWQRSRVVKYFPPYPREA